MKVLIIFILSCVSAYAADTGVRVVSAITTNQTGAVFTRETFTRDGQTNLVRVTKTVHAEFANRMQSFYHDGELVAVYIERTDPKWESFSTPASSCSVGLHFSATKDIETLIITKNRGHDLDGFTVTNGIFYPVSDSELKSDSKSKTR